jgi:putative transcriptional regulator
MIIDAQGKLLVAPPNMPDPRFRKTVVYMWRHDVSGAAGVVINKRCQQPDFKHICNEGMIHRLPKVNHPVYYGGPILTNMVGVLHSTDFVLKSTNGLMDSNVAFTLDRKILEVIAKGEGPKNKLITLGMANWTTGQLEEELEHPRSPAMSWLIMDYDEKLVFGQLDEDRPDDLWERSVSEAIRAKTREITSKVFKD